MYRPFEIEGFEKTHEVLMLGLLQSLQLLASIRSDQVFNGDKLARRRLSNSYSNEAIKLKLVDFLQTMPRRFVL